MLFGLFEHVVLMSLPESIGRRRRMETRLGALGATYTIDPGVTPDASIKSAHPIGHLACAMAHLRIIRRAQAEKWPSVLIFEDDALFRDDTAVRMWSARHDVARLPWDFFYLGGDVQWDRQAAEGLWWVKDVFQTHAYAVRDRIYAQAIAWLEDVIARDFRPFDSFAFPCNRLCARPMLAIQEPGMSGITRVHEDKRDRYFRISGEAREFTESCAELRGGH